MRKLIRFLINHVFFIIFLILEIFSLTLIINFNDFQKSIYFNSANGFIGELHTIINSTTGYFGLKEKSDNLSDENAKLLDRISILESQLEVIKDKEIDTTFVLSEKKYNFLSAKVVNNSTNKGRNYITLNKGAKEGVKPDMGVVSDQGIVGIVSAVSDHFSVVISVLNPIIKFSSKLKKNNFSGYAVWDGIDYRYVKFEDIQEHVPVALGDTIVTTGYTDGFPENIPVGIVEELEKRPEDSYYDIKVKLFTNFKVLSHVKIINYRYKEEQSNLENSVQ